MLNITLIGPANPELSQLLNGLGLQVTVAAADALAPLAASGNGVVPDVLFVDARPSGIPAALAAVRRQRPTLPIVLIGAALEPALLLEAMRAGASEVVVEPFNATEIERTLLRLASQHGGGNGETFAFIGAKGGVGTTTMAVNVAAALARLGKPSRTLLVDLHEAGGDAAVCFAQAPRFTVADAMENTHRLDAVFLHGLVANVSPELDLLAAPDRPVSTPFAGDRLRLLLNVATGTYKYVVIDMPRTDPRLLDALDQLHGIVVVANQELPTVRSAARLMTTLRQRYGREKVHLVMSRSDRHAEIRDEDAERAIGVKAFHSVPSDYRAAIRALNLGRPIVLSNNSDLAGSFTHLAELLAGARGDQRSSLTGLFGRLVHSHDSQG